MVLEKLQWPTKLSLSLSLVRSSQYPVAVLGRLEYSTKKIGCRSRGHHLFQIIHLLYAA